MREARDALGVAVAQELSANLDAPRGGDSQRPGTALQLTRSMGAALEAACRDVVRCFDALLEEFVLPAVGDDIKETIYKLRKTKLTGASRADASASIAPALTLFDALTALSETLAYGLSLCEEMKKKDNFQTSHFGKGMQAFLPVLEAANLLGNSEARSALWRLPEFAADRLAAVLTRQNQAKRLPKTAKGTQDFEPKRTLLRKEIIQTVSNVFEKYGAVEIDTPVFELRETLAGKYGEEGAKLIYYLDDQGGEQLALRYDLTVPFARYVANHKIESIKRYHIGKVYRRDEPQMARGRFREFYQCDLDIAGKFDSMAAEAEILTVLLETLRSLKTCVGPFEIKVNHRVLLDEVMAVAGVREDQFRTACSSIDKLDKEQWAVVRQELLRKGIAAEVCDKIKPFMDLRGTLTDLIPILKTKLADSPKAQAALCELESLRDLLAASGAASGERETVLDMALARGLEYYTGLIYEAVLVGKDGASVGSIAAGGRYDKLIAQFGKDVPAIGVSIGIERVFAMAEQNLKSRQDELRENHTEVLVCSTGGVGITERMKICQQLRDGHIAAEMVMKDKDNMGKQLKAAISNRIPFVVVVNDEQLKQGNVQLKRLSYGDEEATDNEIEASTLVKHLEDLLCKSKTSKEKFKALLL
eukprot:Selendium_serpulae@DN4182_c0_g1_i2.p1